MKNLGFGLMRLPTVSLEDYGNVQIEEMKKMVDIFMEKGFTYYDTAMPYHFGNSEDAFRIAVSERYPRNSFTITDKLSPYKAGSKEELPAMFEGQLKRLGVEYIDYYWLHELGGPITEMAKKLDAFEFVKDLKAKGLVKHIGFSFHEKADELDALLNEFPEAEYVQLQLNYLDWDDEAIEAGKCYETAVKHGKKVMVMEPVKGGSLANLAGPAADLLKAANPDASFASWAIRFAASLPNVEVVLSGMSNVDQMVDNTSFMENFIPLSEKETELLKEAAELIRKDIAIPCTACRYCVEDCPKKIAIPDYFAIYNNIKRFDWPQQLVGATYYRGLSKSHGIPADCIGCGTCEKRCPQHLPIRENLKIVGKLLDEIKDLA